MHILDFGKPYADNLDDFFLHNKMAQSGFTQSIIQRECIDRGLDWHNVDIMQITLLKLADYIESLEVSE